MPAARGRSAVPWRMAFGKRLRGLREARSISQEHLAELAGIHRTYISGVERGQRNISLDLMVRIAKALDVAPAQLFEGWD